MKKAVLFAFNPEFMCFVHVLITALDMKDAGYEVGIVFEGQAVKLPQELDADGSPLKVLWDKVREQDLVYGVCKACSAKLNVLDANLALGLKALDDTMGHPSLRAYMDDGFEVITF